MSIRRRAFSVVVILLGAFLTIVLSKELLELLSAQERIAKEQEAVSRLEKEQQELASQLEHVTSEEFVEKEAREKLLMRRPGEMVVLLPEEDQVDTAEKGEQEVDENLANWEKWAKLFF
ncbi:septum formation initiator family protein [Patescibacteria group bacterium]|nr:septum formation initiator family protein [Patescibacteria group bacterium]